MKLHQASNGRPLSKNEDAVLSQKGQAHIREEGPGLRLLSELNKEVVHQVQRDHQFMRATIDVDATIIKAVKKTTLKAYEGTIGYQPQMAWWAEQSVWIVDKFRDGNVPAAYEVRAFIMQAFSALPGSVRQRRLRGDSAFYNEDVLT